MSIWLTLKKQDEWSAEVELVFKCLVAAPFTIEFTYYVMMSDLEESGVVGVLSSEAQENDTNIVNEKLDQ